MKQFLITLILLPSLLLAVPNNTKNPHSVELRAGVAHSDGKTNPMGSFLYQYFFSENWAVGLAVQPILVSRQIEGGSLVERSGRTITLIPIDFTFAYFFTMDSNLQPFIRGYFGPAIVRGAGSAENLIHLGAGVGFRYFFDESFFVTTELSGNAFALQEKTKPQNGAFFQAGLGMAF
jgi:outer membrane protein W